MKKIKHFSDGYTINVHYNTQTASTLQQLQLEKKKMSIWLTFDNRFPSVQVIYVRLKLQFRIKQKANR